MTFNTNIKGVPITVTVSEWTDKPAEITGVKVRSMVGDLKPLLAADAFLLLDSQIRAGEEFRQECQRPDESAKLPFDDTAVPVIRYQYECDNPGCGIRHESKNKFKVFGTCKYCHTGAMRIVGEREESAKVPFAVEYVGKVMDMAFNAAMGNTMRDMAEAMNRDSSDGPVAESDNGYVLRDDGDEPMTIGHKSGCLCSDCVCERTRVVNREADKE